jgi:hypothetical protein
MLKLAAALVMLPVLNDPNIFARLDGPITAADLIIAAVLLFVLVDKHSELLD